ncbi:MAG: hypothetical protein I8H70_00565 [Burkholderiales bacterium]|nr:hypothetical protein [Burkholderiales bacterium]
MNPYVLLALGLAWAGSAGGAFWYGTDVGRQGEVAKQATLEKVVADVALAAQTGAAAAIAANRPRNTTIKQETEREIQVNTVYRDCVNTPASVRLINEALTGQRPDAPGDRQLPAIVGAQ